MRDLQGRSPFLGGAVAMGNFDGLHQGHIRVLDQLRKMPKPWTVLSFYPSSRDYFNDNHKYIASGTSATLNKGHSGWPRSARTPQAMARLRQELQRNPNVSL